jgi:Major intrinsic protein
MLAAEFVGTFALVFAGCGAVMVDAKTQALGHVGVAISFGLVIMVMIYAVGHISGAHFNRVRDHGRRHRHPRSRSGRCDRDRRHSRARRDVRRPYLRSFR